MMRVFLTLFLAASASAEPARATLRVYPSDRAIAVRASSATATLEVLPRGVATAMLKVLPDDKGYWRLEAIPLAAGATLLVAGKPLLELVPGEGASSDNPPALIEAGNTAIEAPAPANAAASPGACSLRLSNEAASIRQDFDGADVFISGEGAAARAVFLGFVASDQAGANAVTLSTPDSARTWPARVYSWSWTAERPQVARGETAKFRLDIDGLPEGTECDLTLAASNGLQLVEAPGTFVPAGAGCWTARVRAGTFVFEAPADGDAVVTADLAPRCESGK
ncbi:MAG: hypothetical protein FD180_1569 [Planctomycetota bacterium]|nr:MAG: hypothetical protein FD180_1569 [Planctomycetota bacterium]